MQMNLTFIPYNLNNKSLVKNLRGGLCPPL